MRRMCLATVCAAMLGIQGCATFNKMMVNPETGATIDCSWTGSGIGGITMAGINVSQCEKRYKEMGYMTMEEYRTAPKAKLTVTSDPPGAVVYAYGTDQKLVSLGRTTPMELTLKTLWIAPECYMVKLGGQESQKQCFELREQERKAHFELAKGGEGFIHTTHE